MSLIDEQGERYVRMAHLASCGSYAINGVAALHTQLLKADVLRDFAELWPEKFSNKTNGVTPRRWMVLSNPRLAKLITGQIGEGWIRDLYELRQLEPLADDAGFRADWHAIKRDNKSRLARIVRDRTGVIVDPDSVFDVQVKRIHEYKRQHLTALQIIAMYHRIKCNPNAEFTPRTFIFAGKAAPGYHMAKLIIRLITAIGDVVNRDPQVRDQLKVLFLPNFNVTNAQQIYPAADVSEQVSTAGKEASGTGNMKFQMNGALTIGTMDGANIEIREEVGAENFFLFGKTTSEVHELRASGYRPRDIYETNDELRAVLDLLADGFFSRGDGTVFQPLLENLLRYDPYLVLADFPSYVECQGRVSQAYRDVDHWTRMSIYNSTRSGKFSSDRSIREYCSEIWQAQAVPIRLLGQQDVQSGFMQ
jgi:starch phosphorylase